MTAQRQAKAAGNAATNPLRRLHDFGQAVWLDFLARRFIAEGGLKKLIERDGLTGVTSNPSIFERAIAGSADYDSSLSGQLPPEAALFEGDGLTLFADEKNRKAIEKATTLVEVARCEQDAQHALGSAASAARSQPYYLDITHPDANKGTVVTTPSKLLSVPIAEIATIGDMPNDVVMFRNSGLGIAMGNASPDVQAQADAVTASYEDEGFTKAVEQFILHRAPASLPEAR